MSPAITEHDVTVLLGDVREQLATLPAQSVQCVVITSPPYYGLRDYGVKPSEWPAVPEFDVPAMSCALGLEPSPRAFTAHLVLIFRDARRVLADDGVLWLNIGDCYSTADVHLSNAHNANREGGRDIKASVMGAAMGNRRRTPPLPTKNLMGIPWRVAFGLQDDVWVLRNAIVWNKSNAMPESVTDRLSTRYEHVFLFSKSQRYTFDLDAIREPLTRPGDKPRPLSGRNLTPRHITATDNTGWKDHDVAGNPLGRNPGDVWTIPTSPFPGAHFATMPPELARRCILAGCPEDGTVLDPFAGSGTTLKVARALGRKSVGIELNPDYIEIIRDRIGQTPLDFGASA